MPSKKRKSFKCWLELLEEGARLAAWPTQQETVSVEDAFRKVCFANLSYAA